MKFGAGSLQLIAQFFGNYHKKVFLRRPHGYKMANGEFQALVFCGPSGSGKSTFIQKLFKDYPDRFGFSVSHTTRQPRPGEINGMHYHFISKQEMEAAVENGEFIESAMFSNNLYGTSKKAVECVFKAGKVCVLDIDVQGVKQVKQTDLKALYLFIKPPSLEILAKRLRERGTESEESLMKRLNVAQAEIEYGETPMNFDLVLVNDQFENAYETLKDFIFQKI